MYVRLVKCEPAKKAGDFSNQPAFLQICRLKAGSRLPWKALIVYSLLHSCWYCLNADQDSNLCQHINVFGHSVGIKDVSLTHSFYLFFTKGIEIKMHQSI